MHSEDTERQQRIESEAKFARIALIVMLFVIPLGLAVAKTVFGAWSGGDVLVAVGYFAGAAGWWYWYWHHRLKRP